MSLPSTESLPVSSPQRSVPTKLLELAGAITQFNCPVFFCEGELGLAYSCEGGPGHLKLSDIVTHVRATHRILVTRCKVCKEYTFNTSHAAACKNQKRSRNEQQFKVERWKQLFSVLASSGRLPFYGPFSGLSTAGIAEKPPYRLLRPLDRLPRFMLETMAHLRKGVIPISFMSMLEDSQQRPTIEDECWGHQAADTSRRRQQQLQRLEIVKIIHGLANGGAADWKEVFTKVLEAAGNVGDQIYFKSESYAATRHQLACLNVKLVTSEL